MHTQKTIKPQNHCNDIQAAGSSSFKWMELIKANNVVTPYKTVIAALLFGLTMSPLAMRAQIDQDFKRQQHEENKRRAAKQQLHTRCVDIWQKAQYYNRTGRIYIDNNSRILYRNTANDLGEFYCGYMATIGKEAVLNDFLVPAPACPPSFRGSALCKPVAKYLFRKEGTQLILYSKPFNGKKVRRSIFEPLPNYEF